MEFSCFSSAVKLLGIKNYYNCLGIHNISTSLCILHSETKYEGGFGVEYHHAGGVVAFVRERKERRDPTPVLINPGKSEMAWKEMMVLKYNTETWKYYEYPGNCNSF